MIRDALLSWLGLKAAQALTPQHLPQSAAMADVVHSDAVHALNNRTAAALSGFELQARRSGRVTRSLGLGDRLGRAIQEVNEDSDRMRSVFGDAFKEQ